MESWIIVLEGKIVFSSCGLKGKLCSLRVAVSAYVPVSLSVDPSQVSLEWLLVCLGNNHIWAEKEINVKSLCLFSFLESCLNIIEPY